MTTSSLLGAWLGLSMASAGCAPPLDPGAIAAVQIGARGEPPAGCRALGPLEGQDTDRWVSGGPSREPALADLRRKAVRAGGNYVIIDAESPPRDTEYMPAFELRARLFACPTGAPPPAAAPACEPACSPGYTCLRGACVSACNPRCEAGERCFADRICHPISGSP